MEFPDAQTAEGGCPTLTKLEENIGMSNHPTTQDDNCIHNAGDLAAAFAHAAAGSSDVKYVLTLYVAGMRPRSQQAIENIRRLCEEHLQQRYELRIIDIYQQPALAQDAQIIATPTLVKELPLPLRRVIGDMSDDGCVLAALAIKMPESPKPPAQPS